LRKITFLKKARNFFMRTGLTSVELSSIWKVVKPAVAVAQCGNGLTKRRFSQALRLIAAVQNGKRLTPEVATAALLPETWEAFGEHPLPAPRIDPLPCFPSPSPEGNPFREATGDSLAKREMVVGMLPNSRSFPEPETENVVVTDLEFLSVGAQEPPLPEELIIAPNAPPATATAAVFGPVGAPPSETLDDDIFNLAALQKSLLSTSSGAQEQPPQAPRRVLSRSKALSANDAKGNKGRLLTGRCFLSSILTT